MSSSEADPETKICVQVIYLKGSEKLDMAAGIWAREGKTARKGLVFSQLPLRQHRNHSRWLWSTLHSTQRRVSPLEGWVHWGISHCWRMFSGEEQQCIPRGRVKQALTAQESPGREAGARDWELACVSSSDTREPPPASAPSTYLLESFWGLTESSNFIKLSKQSSFNKPAWAFTTTYVTGLAWAWNKLHKWTLNQHSAWNTWSAREMFVKQNTSPLYISDHVPFFD